MNRTQTIQPGTRILPRQASIPEKQRAVQRVSPLTRNIPRSVEQMLAEFTHIPAQTAVLGVCEDGFPILFDLMDERPGPLLVTGDQDCGKTRLLQSMLKTVTALNSPFEVQYAVIASNPDEWMAFENTASESHCYSFSPTYEDAAGRTIMRMSELAEQRRMGRETGPAMLLVIDDLRFMAKADFDVRLNFDWLLKNGPAVQVWPVVSLPTQAALEMSRLVSHFRTRLIGRMEASTNKRITLYEGLDTEDLQSGNEFAVRVQDTWLNFWLPARI